MQHLFHYKNLTLILHKKDAESYDFFFNKGILLVKTAFYKKNVPFATILNYVEMHLLTRHYGYKYEPAIQKQIAAFFAH